MKVQNPHDKFFKESLGNIEIARDFIAHYFPDSILQALDLSTLEPQKDSFINAELEENFSDLLFKVSIVGTEGYLCFLFEHKSYVDRGISLQLLKYMIEIWEAKRNKEQVKELPIIIPLVIYHGEKNWTLPTSFSELLNGYHELPEAVKVHVPNFDYLLYDLSLYGDEDIKGSVQTRMMLTLLRDMLTKSGEALFQSILHTLHHLQGLEDKQSRVGYVETMLRYVFSVGRDLTQRNVERIIQQLETNHIGGSGLAMIIAEIWMEEGREQGREQGLLEGMAIGEAKALSNMTMILLKNKFGTLPADIKDAISQADSPTLQLIMINIFTIEQIDEVRRYL